MAHSTRKAMNGVVRIARHPKVVYRDLGDSEGGVLLHLESGQYHGLNRTGALIWNLLDGHRTMTEIITALGEHLRDAPPKLETDVSTFLQGLEERNLVQILRDDAGPAT